MILVVTHKTDFTTDFVIEKFNTKKIKYFRFNCEEINLINYKYSLFDTQELHIGSSNQYSAVWFRRTMLPPPSPQLSYAENNFILQSYRCLLDNFFTLLNTKWLSHPENITKAENKLFQLKAAKEIGFQIPLTMVTNKKDLIQPFFDSCKCNVIIKPIYIGRIESKNEMQLLFANKIKKEHIEKLGEFDLTPCIFQEFIEKELDIRVTVVDNSIFAASIDSQLDIETSVDWRRKKMKFAPYKLPAIIENKCIELTKKLGLSFGAIDIVKSINGEYFFLEINPNGQWAWIEIDTGLRISDAIINFLN